MFQKMVSGIFFALIMTSPTHAQTTAPSLPNLTISPVEQQIAADVLINLDELTSTSPHRVRILLA